MNLRKLNKQFDIILNEVSNTTKEQIFAARKADFEKAQLKLNKSARLMSKSGIGKPDTITLTMTAGIVDTYETKYNEGEVGEGTSWDNTQRQTITLKLDNSLPYTLAEAVGHYLYCPWINETNIGVRVEDNEISLSFSTQVNDENEEPYESEIEEYKAGEISLWNAFGDIKTEISEIDKPYFIQACKEQGIDVEEW